MGKPAGRRTVPVRVFLSPAELEVWEALRALQTGLPPSRADWIMQHVFDDLEALGEAISHRCKNAILAFEAEEWACRHRWQQAGGRPPATRRAPRPVVPTSSPGTKEGDAPP